MLQRASQKWVEIGLADHALAKPIRGVWKVLCRRPLLSTFILAALVRLPVVLVVRFLSGGSLYQDDQSYLASIERAVKSGSGTEESLWHSNPTFFRPLVLANRLTVLDPLTSQIFIALLGASTATLVAFSVKRLTSNPTASLVAGLGFGTFPSLVLWSSLVMKDPFVWFGTSLTLACLVCLCRPSSSRSSPTPLQAIALIAGLLFGAFITYGARNHASLLLLGASSAACITVWVPLKRALPLLLISASLVPLFLGYGPFAKRILENGSTSFAKNRSAEVAQAETAVNCWEIPFVGQGSPDEGGWTNDLKCLPSTFAMFTTMPWPNQVVTNPSLWPPLLELPLWLTLYALALRRPRNALPTPVRTFCILHLIFTLLFWSFVDRVVGTAFRHRGEMLAALVVLACSQSFSTPRITNPSVDK